MGQSKKAGSLGSPLRDTKCVYTVDSPGQLLPSPGDLSQNVKENYSLIGKLT